MVRALQIFAVLLLVAVLAIAHWGFSTVFNWTTPQFAGGFGAGVVFAGVWFLILKQFGLKLD